MINKIFNYGEDYLSASIVFEIAKGEARGVINDATKAKITQSEGYVEKIANGDQAVYGINTGFGPLCTTRISAKETKLLQENILKSHSVGVGEPISEELSKMMLILKLNSLAKGFSGISFVVIERILWFIENDIIPVVPSQGSVGASGDLAPLSHLFLPLIGLGKVYQNGQIVPVEKVYQEKNISNVELTPKDGLALINGTQFMLAHAVKIIKDFQSLLAHADIIGAMMVEGLLGSRSPFLPELHQTRPHKGNIHVASRLSAFLADSAFGDATQNFSKVQDPYSLRCMPQIHGASRNAWLHLKETIEVELNSVTDNPIVFNENHTVSGGSFHGQPIAMAMDYVCLAASELGNVSDRRTYLSLEGNIEDGLPKLLMKETGTNSGFMILQYTAAALASENKSLCFPASADSIPTSLGQEDHVSMGSISGRKALAVIKNVEKILGIELMCATQAIDFRRPLKSSKMLEEVHDLVRSEIAFAENDRFFGEDIEKAIEIVSSNKILEISKKHHSSFTEFDGLFEKF